MTLERPEQRIAPSWQPALAAWREELKQRSGSKWTDQHYARHVRRFMSIVGQPEYATSADVHTYCYATFERPPGPEEVESRRKALRSFYGFLGRMGRVSHNPTDGVKAPKKREPLPRGLNAAELNLLLSHIPGGASGTRDWSIVRSLVLTGLRIRELLSLRRADISVERDRTMYTVRVKGGATRSRELPAPVIGWVDLACKARGSSFAELGPDAKLFDVTYQVFRRRLKVYAARAGLPHATPHALRHSGAKLRLDAGSSVEDIQRFLGHKSLANTVRYLQRLEGQEDAGWRGALAQVGW